MTQFNLHCLAALVGVSSLYAQPPNPAPTNHVLQLEGGNNSSLQLPSHIFDGQKAITVEAWVKWQGFGEFSRVFDFGKQYKEIDIANVGTTSELKFVLWPNSKGQYRIAAWNVLNTNQWIHVAAVADQAGLRLYCNGTLFGKTAWTGPLWNGGDLPLKSSQPGAKPMPVPNGDHNYVGRANWPGPDFHGQIDDFQVWKVARTAKEIRQDMFEHLTGKEPGLVGLWNFEMLQEEAEDLGQKEFQPDLQKIHGAGKHLLGLINEILDLSKIEAGKMTLYLEDFEVAELVNEVEATVQPLVTKNGNQLEVECPPDIGTMHADMTKVRQTLFNLLSNASKFTEKGTIGLSVKRETGSDRALAVPSSRFTGHASRFTFQTPASA